MKIDIPCLLAQLARRRPIFHSEADFQHERAWQIRACYPCVEIRLEVPFGIDGSNDPGKGRSRAALDILIRHRGRKMALELKYMCAGLSHIIDDESFSLKNQSAHDVRRYDVWKDVERMEAFVNNHPGASAAVIALTNDPAYWAGPKKTNTNEAEFSLRERRREKGSLEWAPQTSGGTKRGRENPICLKNSYELHWKDYFIIKTGVKNGNFRYLYLPVPPS